MRADYDSKVDTLSIELRAVRRFDRQEQLDEDHCTVGIVGGRVVDVELLSPRSNLELLDLVSERYGLDGEALHAAAEATLAAPDRAVTIDVAVRAEA